MRATLIRAGVRLGSSRGSVAPHPTAPHVGDGLKWQLKSPSSRRHVSFFNQLYELG